MQLFRKRWNFSHTHHIVFDRVHHRFVCALIHLTQSNACPRQAGTFVDDYSYTSDSCQRGSRRSCQSCGTLVVVVVAGLLLASLLRQLLDSHRRHHRQDVIHFSSRNCERSGCVVERGRETGRS